MQDYGFFPAISGLASRIEGHGSPICNPCTVTVDPDQWQRTVTELLHATERLAAAEEKRHAAMEREHEAARRAIKQMREVVAALADFSIHEEGSEEEVSRARAASDAIEEYVDRSGVPVAYEVMLRDGLLVEKIELAIEKVERAQ